MVAESALDADGRLLFVIGTGQRLAALRAAGLAAQWEVTTGHFTPGPAVNGDGVGVQHRRRAGRAVVYEAADGKLRAGVAVGRSGPGAGHRPGRRVGRPVGKFARRIWCASGPPWNGWQTPPFLRRRRPLL